MAKTGLEKLITDIQDYFDYYEAPNYSEELNKLTGNTYLHDARRKFVKYYLKEGIHDIKNFLQDYK